MSYAAQRWAKAQVLRIGHDPMAIAVLGIIADAYRPDGRCPLNRAAIALRVGAAKRATVVAALKRLVARGVLTYDVIRDATGTVLGTRYTLIGFKEDEWPKDRVGEAVMIEQATAAGMTPEDWWPRIGDPTLPPVEDLIDTFSGETPAEGDSPRNGETLPPKNVGSLSPQNGGTLSPLNGHKTVYNGINGNNGNYSFTACEESHSAREVSNLESLADLYPEPEDRATEITIEKSAAEKSAAEPQKTEPAAKAEPKPRAKAAKKREPYADFAAIAAEFAAHGVSEDVLREYLAIRKDKGIREFGPIARAQFVHNAEKNGLTVLECMLECIACGWVKYFPPKGAQTTQASARRPAAPSRRNASGFDPYDRTDVSRYGPAKTKAEVQAELEKAKAADEQAALEGLPF